MYKMVAIIGYKKSIKIQISDQFFSNSFFSSGFRSLLSKNVGYNLNPDLIRIEFGIVEGVGSYYKHANCGERPSLASCDNSFPARIPKILPITEKIGPITKSA